MQNMLIDRQITKELKNHLAKKEMTLLLGPRQSGKTTVLRYLEAKLKKDGKRTVFLNLDILADKEKLADQTEFINFLRSLSLKKKHYIFIDEVQRIPEAGIFLKGVYDSNPNCKFILSGSSSLEIKNKIVEPLTGRKRTFYLPTLTFEEFLNFKAPDLKSLSVIRLSFRKKVLMLLDEYLRFGGYPRVVIEESHQEKVKILEEIYTSYIEKDIELFFEVRNKSSFLKLVNILAAELGGLLNKDAISAEIGSNRLTIDNFLNYLQASFVINLLSPFFSRPRREIIKSPKVYFFDTGLRNLMVKNFSPLQTRTDKGQLFENFILKEVSLKLGPTEKINYWRTRIGAEVDFVLSRGKEVLAGIEVKANSRQNLKPEIAMKSFMEKYAPEQIYLLNFLNFYKISDLKI